MTERGKKSTHLSTKETQLLPLLGRTPKFEIVVIRIRQVEFTCPRQQETRISKPSAQERAQATNKLTLDIGDRAEVKMHGNGRIGLIRIDSEENKLPTRIHRHSDDRPDPHPLPKDVLLPRQPLIKRINNAISRVLVVDEKEDRSLIAVLPEMGVLVHLLPGEAAVASEECVRVGVGDEGFSDVSDGEHEADGGGGGVGRSGIASFGEAVDVKSAVLGWKGTERSDGRATEERRRKKHERFRCTQKVVPANPSSAES